MSGPFEKHTVQAITAHDIPERAPIQVEPGEVVKVEQRDTTWPAFVFVTFDRGRGWVPARHLDIRGDTGVVVNSYDTTELSTSAGEELEVVERDDESGWLWCRNQDGGEGWVPVSSVE
jgi:hypothetical protein